MHVTDPIKSLSCHRATRNAHVPEWHSCPCADLPAITAIPRRDVPRTRLRTAQCPVRTPLRAALHIMATEQSGIMLMSPAIRRSLPSTQQNLTKNKCHNVKTGFRQKNPISVKRISTANIDQYLEVINTIC